MVGTDLSLRNDPHECRLDSYPRINLPNVSRRPRSLGRNFIRHLPPEKIVALPVDLSDHCHARCLPRWPFRQFGKEGTQRHTCGRREDHCCRVYEDCREEGR